MAKAKKKKSTKAKGTRKVAKGKKPAVKRGRGRPKKK